MNDKETSEQAVLKVAHVVEAMEDDLESAVQLVINELSEILAKNFVGQVLDHKKYKQFLESIKGKDEEMVCEINPDDEVKDNVVPIK